MKEIWDTTKEVFGNEKNISQIFELYKHLFTLQQGKMLFLLTFQYFVEFRKVGSSLTSNGWFKDSKGLSPDLVIEKFLYRLNSSLVMRVQDQILIGNSISSLIATYYRFILYGSSCLY